MTLTPTQIRAILAGLDARPEKAFGQNFLIDQSTLNAVVEAAELNVNDIALEIGPGLGALTEDLLATGAQVLTIERDRKFIDYLRTKFGSQKNFSLTQGDAAELNWNELLPADRPWKFVSNLPYAISSYALRMALWAPKPASRVVVMLQREVAERALALLRPTADSSRSSLLSLMVALRCESGLIARRVAPGCFFPSPKVESAILVLSPFAPEKQSSKWGIEPEKIMQLAKRGFAHPRKQLFSTLQVRDRADVLALAIQSTKEVRPEALSVEQWASLTCLLQPSLGSIGSHGDK